MASNHMRMMDQFTPWGSLTFDIAGGSGGSYSPVAAGASAPRPERPAILDQTAQTYFSQNAEDYWGTGGGEGRLGGGSFAEGSYSPNNLAEFERRKEEARRQYLDDLAAWEAGGGGGGGGGGGAASGGAGYMTWRDPTTGQEYQIPRYQSRMTLHPELQAGLEAQFTAGRRLSEEIANNAAIPIARPELMSQFADVGDITRTFDRGGDIRMTYGDPEGYAEQVRRVEDALMERMQPYIDAERSTLDTQLANKGIMAGSTAFDRENDRFTRGVNDARLGAILNAGQEQNRLADLDRSRAVFENAAQSQQFGQNQSLASFQNMAQQQAYGQERDRAGFFNNAQLAQFNADQQARAMPINQLGALLGAGQVATPPVQFIGAEGIPTVDYAGMVYKNADLEMQAYQQQQANSRAMMNGLFGLAGRLIG